MIEISALSDKSDETETKIPNLCKTIEAQANDFACHQAIIFVGKLNVTIIYDANEVLMRVLSIDDVRNDSCPSYYAQELSTTATTCYRQDAQRNF